MNNLHLRMMITFKIMINIVSAEFSLQIEVIFYVWFWFLFDQPLCFLRTIMTLKAINEIIYFEFA